MLSLEQCPGPEEVGPEEVQEWRECTGGGRVGGVAGGVQAKTCWKRTKCC